VRAVHERLKAARAPRPRVAVVEWTAPVFLAGHWGPEMVKRAGAVDVLGVAGEHSTTVPLDALADADPEIVVVAPCGYDLARATAEARTLRDDPRWGWLAGRAVWAVDANAYVSRPAPRLVDGVELFAQLFHPALFGAPDPSRATRVG
jgi:iron complex transport system substrate-binding protein